MLSKIEENEYIKSIPLETTGEERRAAYAVISGYRDDKNPEQIANYYTVSIDLVVKWYESFGFGKISENGTKKRGRKTKDISGYIKSNIGKIVTPKTVSEELGISLPTFYNFYNSNRHLFKKVKRGEFQIVDPSEGR
jgi:hypothetical protein